MFSLNKIGEEGRIGSAWKQEGLGGSRGVREVGGRNGPKYVYTYN
jgi:hypothetical protein